MKKLLLGLGTLVAVTAPVVSVIACSDWGKMEIKDLHAKTTKTEADFLANANIQIKLVEDQNNEVKFLDAKVSEEKSKALDTSNMNDDQKKAEATKVADRLTAYKTSFIALVNASSRDDAAKTNAINLVNAQVNILNIRNTMYNLIPNTDQIQPLLGITPSDVKKPVLVKNDNGSLSKVTSIAYDAKTKELKITTWFLNEYNEVYVTHKITVEFPKPVVTP